MKKEKYIVRKLISILIVILVAACTTPEPADTLMADLFLNPGNEARPRAYWNWLNGDVTPEGITKDLEEAKEKGLGGLEIWDTEAMRNPDGLVPAGPPFLGPHSVSVIQHAMKEAKRLELDLGLIASSGWNAGGPWVPPNLASKNLYFSEKVLEGSVAYSSELPFPEFPRQCPVGEDGLPKWYIDVAVLAWPDYENKIIPDLSDVINITDNFKDGVLNWTPPEGKWRVLRYVCTNNGQQLIAASPNSKGPFIDFLDPEATRFHFEYILDIIGIPKGGAPDNPLKILELDSMELHEGIQWTTKFREWFMKYHGYDPIAWLPSLSGWTITNEDESGRFEYDYKKTVSDLLIFSHYTTGSEVCEEYGLELSAEAGGPGPPIWYSCPVDALKALGNVHIPRGEFWIRNRNNLFLIKEIASAAHIYGRQYVDAESWTTWWRWKDGPFDRKLWVDRAFCEGLNRITYHGYSNSPDEFGYPGRSYHAGVDMNPRVVWWSKARPFMDYLGRCCHMLQQGLFVADVAYYYGDKAPNFWPPVANVPEKPLLEGLGTGYDYDVVNSDVILNRMSVQDGKILLPDGMSYKVLVLPDQKDMQLEVLHKLEQLVSNGATIIGPKPSVVPGLKDHMDKTPELKALADKMWGKCDGVSVKENTYGDGTVIWGYTSKEWLQKVSVNPDFFCVERKYDSKLDYIHRQTEDTDIYFVRNKSLETIKTECLFRAQDSDPQFWDPTDGSRHMIYNYTKMDNRTAVQIELAPGASTFVVFGILPDVDTKGTIIENMHTPVDIDGDWRVTFDPNWGAPAEVTFPELISWTEHENEGVKYYSGAGNYHKAFDVSEDWLAADKKVYIDLGDVREIAEIFVNGTSTGIVWKPPFRTDISEYIRSGKNELRIEVMNLWCNRMAGDNELPKDQRFTRSNIETHGYRTDPNYWVVEPAGLLGPVKLILSNIKEK